VGLTDRRVIRSFRTKARGGAFTMAPRNSLIAAIGGDTTATMLAIAQNIEPLHLKRLSRAMVTGFDGSCTRDAECADGFCVSVRCSYIDPLPERCAGRPGPISTCVPNSDLGYCTARNGDWAGSSFTACTPNSTSCRVSSDCSAGNACILGRCRANQFCNVEQNTQCPAGQRCLGSYSAETGTCTTPASDPACGAREHCLAASDIVLDLPDQLFALKERRGLEIGAISLIGFSGVMVHGGGVTRDYGEVAWCLPELTAAGTRSYSLSEAASRATLREVFDGVTPRHEIFTLGRYIGTLSSDDNYLWMEHSVEHRCVPILSPWQTPFPRQLNPRTIAFVDLDGDGVDELRVGFAFGDATAESDPAIWRCYDIFGQPAAGRCAP
jgi:hypothetical protein